MAYFRREISSPDAMLEIGQQRDSSAQLLHFFGFNDAIGTAYETVWNNGGGQYVYPSQALTMSCVSTSAEDTQTILISGLDEDYQEIYDVVQLNGTTPVATTNQFYRINAARTLAGVNVGAISISNSGTVYAYIGPDLGTHQAIIYTVPVGRSLYIHQVTFNSGTVNPNKYMTARGSIISSTGVENRFWESTFQRDIYFNLRVPFIVREKTDFLIEAKSSSGENELSIYMGAVLLEDYV